MKITEKQFRVLLTTLDDTLCVEGAFMTYNREERMAIFEAIQKQRRAEMIEIGETKNDN